MMMREPLNLNPIPPPEERTSEPFKSPAALRRRIAERQINKSSNFTRAMAQDAWPRQRREDRVFPNAWGVPRIGHLVADDDCYANQMD
jgi:hypothetical protein